MVAIGETGLDYYQMEERKGGRSIADMEWQRERFRVHIRAAQQTRKPLVIHTREASADTLAILREEGETGSGKAAGGVFHCFTETAEVARAALDLGFYISFSGILTFKKAQDLRDVAAFVPLDRMLIETDSPYLAPVPYRGKTNNPSYVPYRRAADRPAAQTAGRGDREGHQRQFRDPVQRGEDMTELLQEIHLSCCYCWHLFPRTPSHYDDFFRAVRADNAERREEPARNGIRPQHARRQGPDRLADRGARAVAEGDPGADGIRRRPMSRRAMRRTRVR